MWCPSFAGTTNVLEEETTIPDRGSHGGLSGMVLEPSFLFSSDVLQIAIPELLSQAGVSGRQFAHLLIRAHQEKHQNRFPELERAAEQVGGKLMPQSVDSLQGICRQLGLKIRWFTKLSPAKLDGLGVPAGSFVRSYFEAPNVIYLNKELQGQRQSRDR